MISSTWKPRAKSPIRFLFALSTQSAKEKSYLEGFPVHPEEMNTQLAPHALTHWLNTALTSRGPGPHLPDLG